MQLIFSCLAVLFRAYEALSRSTTTSLVHGLSHISIFLFNKSGLNGYAQFQSEYTQLVYYYKTNQAVESLTISSVDSTLVVEPGTSITYVALPSTQLIHALLLETWYQRILLLFLSRSKYYQYISVSFKTAQNHLQRARCLPKAFIDSPAIPYPYEPTTVTNKGHDPIYLSFRTTLLISSKPVLIQHQQRTITTHITASSQHEKQYRTICFYLDNVSLKGLQDIVSKTSAMPYLSSLLSSPNTFVPISNTSISNWTYPAAISMFSGLSFEDHKHFHRKTRPSLSLNDTIYTSRLLPQLQEKLSTLYTSAYLCGTNWRNRPEHGSHALFDHCSNNPLADDIYGVLSQAFKQLDVAGPSSTFHWIYIMDSHHPIRSPLHSSHTLSSLSISSGLQYETGPKSSVRNFQTSAETYTSQLVSLDQKLKHIVDYSRYLAPHLRHRVVLLSDHGTDFLDPDTEYSRTLEKHQPFFCLYDDDPSIAPHLSQLSVSVDPTEYISFAADPLSHLRILNKSPQYSQILYPGKPYQYLNLFHDDLYRYTTNQNMPLTNWAAKDDMVSLARILTDGSWHLIRRSDVQLISEDQLPPAVAYHFLSTLDHWRSSTKNRI